MQFGLSEYLGELSEESNATVTGGSVGVLVIVSGLLVVAPAQTSSMVSTFEEFLLFDVGFVFALTLFGSLICLTVIAVGPWGRFVLGGNDADPAYDDASYFAMLFAIGIASGIAFFGPGEAVNYMVTLPPGIEESAPLRQKGIWGMSFTLTHWGIITSATTAVFAVPIGYYNTRHDAPFRVSSALYPLIRDRPALAGLIDVFAISGLVFGLSSSTMETTRNFLNGIEPDVEHAVVDGLDGQPRGLVVPLDDGRRMDVVVEQVLGLRQQFASQHGRGRGAVPDLVLLGLGDLHDHLGGGMFDVHLVEDGRAVVRDDDVARVGDEHLVHPARAQCRAYRFAHRLAGGDVRRLGVLAAGALGVLAENEHGLSTHASLARLGHG